jgi:hypothetical protein
MATISGCIICHTPMGERGQRIKSKEFAGGWEMKFETVRFVTANLTPAGGTWMSDATKDEFIGRFRCWGKMPPTPATKGRNTIMPWQAYAGMTDQDLGAIYDFLKTLPPQGGPINSFPDADDMKEAVAAQ